MNGGNPSRKNPFIAAFLSIIPGMGQIYNEQVGKGLFIFIIFIASILLLFMNQLLHYLPIYLHPMSGLYPEGGLWGSMFNFPLDRVFFTQIYPIVWLLLIVPAIYLYAISDAVTTSHRINRSNPSQPQPSPQGTSGTTNDQETLRTEAQQKMGTADEKSTPAAEPSAHRTHGLYSAKFLFGLALVVIGGLSVMDQMGYSISLDQIWPLIPLIFGLRLLRDYTRDRSQGQFILGTVFTAFGVIFLLQNWDIAYPWEYVEDNWQVILLVIGAVMILQDILDRRRKRGKG